MPVVLQNVGGISALNNPGAKNVTITAGTPGNVNSSAHGLTTGTAICFIPQNTNRFDSAIPSPLVYGNIYYVKTVVDANNYTVSATNGGTALTLTGTQVIG